MVLLALSGDIESSTSAVDMIINGAEQGTYLVSKNPPFPISDTDTTNTIIIYYQ